MQFVAGILLWIGVFLGLIVFGFVLKMCVNWALRPIGTKPRTEPELRAFPIVFPPRKE